MVALCLAVGGWGIWAYAWVAESDTGYPDGLACTRNGQWSAAYVSCMKRAELSGAIAWALTLALAVAGLTLVGRALLEDRAASGSVPLVAAALLVSLALASAGIGAWAHGVRGGYYEDRIGPTIWWLANSAAICAGLVAGWFLTPASDRDHAVAREKTRVGSVARDRQEST